MKITALVGFLSLLLAGTALAAPRTPVVTFSRADLARLMGETCGPAFARKQIHAHRNSMGNMVYLASEDHSEAVIWANSQQCNELSTDTLDIWRDDKGNVSAQLIWKDERPMLMVGQFDPARGKRFDVDRSGQYVLISHGTSSTLSAVSRPYRTLHQLQIDGQRIFVRKRALLVVGGNPATGQLEARPIRVGDTGMIDEAPIQIGMPAGVQVLDYSEASDDLLLGGVTPDGTSAFVIYNLGSGESSGITPDRPGDNLAMFVAEKGIRDRLTGRAGPGAPPAGAPLPPGGAPPLAR